jgi:Zn-dependent M28 family amino/carboxypeptidase
MLGASTAKTIAFFTWSAQSPVFNILGIICVALAPVVGLFAVFHTYKPVPGAMDDMAGVAVATALGKYLADAKNGGSFFPENTEVVLFGVGAEEAGLRGARRYVARHKEELRAIPTYTLMLDGICDERYFTVINREICTGAKHSPELIKLAQECASARGRNILVKMIPLGASDASEFSNAGLQATCIICQNSDKLVPNYHTRHDTLENIRPESLTYSLRLVIDMLERIDKKN